MRSSAPLLLVLLLLACTGPAQAPDGSADQPGEAPAQASAADPQEHDSFYVPTADDLDRLVEPGQPPAPWVAAEHGLRLVLPAGWQVGDEAPGPAAASVVLRPVAGPAELTLRLGPPGVPDDPEAARELVWSSLADPSYREAGRTTRTVAGFGSVPGLTVDTDAEGLAVRVRHAYLLVHGRLALLQDVVPVADAEGLQAEADVVWDGLELLDLPEGVVRQRHLKALADRCGSEVDWAPDWQTAAARALEARVPVLVSFQRYPGFDVPDQALTGPFMDEDVIALVNRRTVPLRATSSEGLPFAAADRYGLGPHTFGAATLLVDPRDGSVLWDGPTPADALLREALAELPEALAGTRPDPAAPRAARAAEHAARGELSQAWRLLGAPEGEDQRLLAARLHLRQRDPSAALTVLEPLPPDHDAATLLRLAALRFLARHDEAHGLARALLSRETSADHRAQGLLAMGLLTLQREDHAAAEPWLDRVIDEHGESRWAWGAAALVTSDVWALERRWRQDGLDDELELDLVRPPRYAPLPLELVDQAGDDALAWLLEHQTEDGHWLLPGSLSRPADEPPNDFELSVASHAVLALLPRAREPGVDAALERATAWLLAATRRSLDGPGDAAYMDYSVWSRPALLEALAALVDAGRVPRAQARPLVADLAAELTARAKPEGGWSYYLTGDLDSAPPTVLSAMSFTTAAAVLGLVAARDADLADPSLLQPLIDSGLTALERGRREDGSFEYMIAASGAPRDPGRGAGDVGRGPVCVAALIAGGRAGADELATALAAFLPHRESYVRERGKHLMHAGVGAQGSHYLLFDLLHAARATAALPADQRGDAVPQLRAALLACRVDDGSFSDLPIMGRAWGAAAGLAALDVLAGCE